MKFFLHPIVTEEAISAAREGLTKVDVYRQQYFVSLVAYALQRPPFPTRTTNWESSVSDADMDPPRVRDRIVRSTLFLVATGQPKKKHRDWLVSFVNAELNERTDPLNRFCGSADAAYKVLDGVRRDLKAHGRLREYQVTRPIFSCTPSLTGLRGRSSQSAKRTAIVCVGCRIAWTG